MSSSSSSSPPPHGPHLIETETTVLQKETENECSPYFVDITTLPNDQKQHLQQVGLLDQNGIQLLREKHLKYVSQVWKQPLKAPFISLDSSRPWILYWCLHSYDLLCSGTGTAAWKISNDEGLKMIQTLRECFTSYNTSDVPSIVPQDDPYYHRRGEEYHYYCGGFGGGPKQMAHAATTYASVLVLCILATNDQRDGDDDDNSNDDCTASNHYSIEAKHFLQQIRIPLYRWFCSLQTPNGGYRMHHDGEVDVRATYTVVTCCKLLHLLTPTIQNQSVIDFVVSCQSQYEGGIGGEPYAEAHGGYTFCGVAALHVMNSLPKLDVSLLLGWLARRQMSYEGGFSGRSNKLVDGCYSFWQVRKYE
jgi:protein farnesyltransferase subunit beta